MKLPCLPRPEIDLSLERDSYPGTSGAEIALSPGRVVWRLPEAADQANLRLAGHQGSMSDYEGLLVTFQEGSQAARPSARSWHYTPSEVARASLQPPPPCETGRRSCWTPPQDDLLALNLDGLKRVDGPSGTELHCIPMLFKRALKGSARTKKLCGTLACWYPGCPGPTPAQHWGGVARWDCKDHEVRLNPDLRKIGPASKGCIERCGGESPPKLILNDHCHVCEFLMRCHDRAVQEDNLSLLRHGGEGDQGYARKGYSRLPSSRTRFRPGRGRRAEQKEPALHALHFSLIQ